MCRRYTGVPLKQLSPTISHQLSRLWLSAPWQWRFPEPRAVGLGSAGFISRHLDLFLPGSRMLEEVETNSIRGNG